MICNFIHTPFVRHPIQMNEENMMWEKCCKNTEINKTSHIWF